MQYIALDLEWNQPFEESLMIKGPVCLTGEIIQIGAVKLDESYKQVDTFKIIVHPVKYRNLHWKVAKITNLTNEDLQYGFDFPKALSLFRKWCGKEYSFLTWGQDDEEILRENLALYSIEPVWLPKFYDAQKIFGFQTGKPNRQFSLLNALKYFHEDALDAHDALHDAMNTVRVCHHLDLNAAFSYYDEMIKSTASSDRTVPRYSSRGEALESEQITSFLCRTCSKMVKCGEWVKKRHEVRMALADCPDCSRYYVQVRFRRDGDECFRATRRIQILTDELMNQYQKTRQERIAAEEAFLKK